MPAMGLGKRRRARAISSEVTPNQNPDEPGLPRYVADNESIVNRDIVLWHTVTFHHVTAAEDYPVLPREHASFELKPHNFFDRNPALELRRAPPSRCCRDVPHLTEPAHFKRARSRGVVRDRERSRPTGSRGLRAGGATAE